MKHGVASSESQEILTSSEHPPGAGTPYGTELPPQEALPLRDLPKSFWHSITSPHKMPRRYFVAIMAFFGFGNIYAMRVNLSIAILAMMKQNRTFIINGTTIVRPPEFSHWNVMDMSFILSSFFYGYIVTQLPGGWFAAKYGGRLVFGLGILGTAFLTFLTPPLAHMGKAALVVVRVAEGVFEGVTYPAIHAVWSHWAPPMEKTKLATIAFAGSYFGTFISLPVSAYLGANWGWPSIFYVFGLLAIFWCMLWFKNVSETPADDRKMDREELAYIHQSIGFTREQVKQLAAIKEGKKGPQYVSLLNVNPPWRKILTSKAVWAIVVAHFCENWGFYTMLTFLPKFMLDTLDGYTFEKAGLVGALPYLVMGIIVISGGQLADYVREKKQWPTVAVRRIFCSGAFLCQTFFIILTAHGPVPWVVVTFVTIAIGVGGFAWSGFSVNHLDIAPQFASVLMGISNTFATLPGILGPPLVGLIVTSKDKDELIWQWRSIFYIAAAVYAFGAVVYSLWASGDIQSWAEIQGGYMSRLDDLNEKGEATTGQQQPQPIID